GNDIIRSRAVDMAFSIADQLGREEINRLKAIAGATEREVGTGPAMRLLLRIAQGTGPQAENARTALADALRTNPSRARDPASVAGEVTLPAVRTALAEAFARDASGVPTATLLATLAPEGDAAGTARLATLLASEDRSHSLDAK